MTWHTRPDCPLHQGRIQNASMDVPRLSKAEIQADLDSSLQRLGVGSIFTGCIGTRQVTPSKKSFSPSRIVQAGKIKHAGFSNWTQSRAEEARLGAERLGVEGFVASQNMWSLAKPDVSRPTWAFIDEAFVRWHVKHGRSRLPIWARPAATFDASNKTRSTTFPPDARSDSSLITRKIAIASTPAPPSTKIWPFGGTGRAWLPPESTLSRRCAHRSKDIGGSEGQP